MKNRHNIIFTGPAGAGKTTAIHSISDVPLVNTRMSAAGELTTSQRSSATSAMVCGLITLSDREKIHLYGVPISGRLDCNLDELIQGGIGLVLLLDNTRPDPFKDMLFFLSLLEQFIASTAVVIGVTHIDLISKPTIADYHRQLQGTGLRAPIFAVDARVRNDISLLVQALIYSLDPGLPE
ncbi:MAG: GTP-binding protein [Gammaproteobacteria bacterium]